MFRLKILLMISCLACSVQVAFAEKQARYLLGAMPLPSNQFPNSYGSYSKGCLAGGQAMLESGPYEFGNWFDGNGIAPNK